MWWSRVDFLYFERRIEKSESLRPGQLTKSESKLIKVY